MSSDWSEFLRQQGARYSDGWVRDFGNPADERRAARGGNVLVDLSHLSLIRAGGADVKTFLNGQLTNDVALIDAAHSQLSAWCSPKGRMLAVFRVLLRANHYFLQLPALLRDDVIKRLRMYVLRSKVTLENADDTYVRIGVAGPDASSLARTAAGLAPEGDNAVATSDRLIVLRLPGIHPRFEMLAAPAAAPALWNDLRRGTVPAGAEAWVWHDIHAGVPTVLPETSDAFVPQMANLELLGGVSFSKGCYTGQEIVARVHYRGRLKQRMYRAHVEAAHAPPAGAPIYAPGARRQSTGTVVVAAASPEDGYDLLAVIHCDAAAAGELHLGNAEGPRLTMEPLPYAVPV